MTAPDGLSLTRRTVLGGLATSAALGAGTSVTAAHEGECADAEYSCGPVEVESFDGTVLAGHLYEPAGEGPHPAILMTHGWGGDHAVAYLQRYADTYTSNGYVVLTYDSRGFGESEGEVGVDGPKEVADALTLIDRLGSGTVGGSTVSVAIGDDGPVVGMDSLSYAGGIQTNTAAARETPLEGRLTDQYDSYGQDFELSFETFDLSVANPLDAIVPRWGWYDLVYSLAPHGVLKSGWGALLYATGVGGARGVSSGDGTPAQHDIEDGVTREVHESFLLGTAANELPDDSKAFYRARSPVGKLDRIDTPALFIGGWNDTLFLPNEQRWLYEGLRRRGIEARLCLVYTGHTVFGETPTTDQQAFIDSLALRWLDAHLKGRDHELPPVVFEAIDETFRAADGIPPNGATTWTLPLSRAAGEGTSVVVNSVAPSSGSQLSPENRDYAQGVTAVDFDFHIVRPTTGFGPPMLRVWVEPLGTETRLFTKLYHVTGEGATLINDQVVPLRVEGAGTVQEVKIELPAFQRPFEPGDALRFTVAATDAGFSSSRESAGARIHHSPEYPSTIDVPAIFGQREFPILYP